MYQFKKCAMLALAFVIIFGITSPVFAQSRRISIYRLDGDDITFDRGTRSQSAARQGQRLSEGHNVTTGRDSQAYFQLDAASIVEMNEQSKVSVSKLNANNIALTVISGEALVFAEPQKRGQTLELRIGNSALSVRGTLFVIGHGSEDAAIITMLEGSGVVDDTPLAAGSVMRIYEDSDRQELVVSDMDIEDMNLFTLEAIRDYQELLMGTGLLSQDMLEDVSALIDNLLKEKEASRPVVSDARRRRDAARNPAPPRNSGRDSSQNATSDMPAGQGHGDMNGSNISDDIMERSIHEIMDRINSSNMESNTNTPNTSHQTPMPPTQLHP